MSEYLHQLETVLKEFDEIINHSLTYSIDEDAHRVKLKIKVDFLGGGKFEGFEYSKITDKVLFKIKYRYNFVFKDQILRWDNAPHHKSILTFPHHLHINSKVVDSHEPDLKFVIDYILKFLARLPS